jgi:hypothetical protein
MIDLIVIILAIHCIAICIIVQNINRKKVKFSNKLDLCMVDVVSPINSPVMKPLIRHKSMVKLFNFNPENQIVPKEMKCGLANCNNNLNNNYYMAFDKRFCSIECRNVEVERSDPQEWLNTIYDQYELSIIEDEMQ